MARGLSVIELVRDRFRKRGLYDTPGYWDKKAEAYQGLARSNWPSNSYNELLHARQMERIDANLSDVTGLSIADVGCGTGRASLHLARRGARVTGFDFSPRALEVARADAEKEGLDVNFQLHDVMADPDPTYQKSFDRVLVLGCLTLACREISTLDRALTHVSSLVKPGGKVLFVEPLHRSKLLSRILSLSVEEFTDRAAEAGLILERREGILFVPARYALAFRDLPAPIAGPVFQAGEALLESSRSFDFLSDYKLLLFQRAR